jgi:hypothetical protein
MPYLNITGRGPNDSGNYGRRSNARTHTSEINISVSCPACGALKGRPCKDVNGSVVKHVHQVRAKRASGKQ